jgi:dUTP pyrophosphatase
MELPPSYEAYIIPRSSTFKNFGLILSNHLGLIDTLYNGNEDYWLGMFIAVKDGSMERGDRVAQFRIQEKMPEFEFEVVDLLGNSNRNGYGASGVK